MSYTELQISEIDPSVVYVSPKELRKRAGVSQTTLYNHIIKGKLDALRFRNKTYFHPDVANAYETLAKCGLLG